MTGGVPTGPRLDRAAVERIVKRAAELQASERDIGDGLTEKELLQLGQDVGIPDAYLKQAMLEEQTRVDVESEAGLLARLAGPKFVHASRSFPGEASRVEAALHRWMTDGELLQVKRRFPQYTSWEAKQGAVASIRRALSMGGRPYALSRAREIVGQVTALDQGRCHVRLLADLSNTRRERVGWASGLVTAGAASGVVGVVLGIAVPVAAAPLVLAGGIGWIVARTRLQEIERVHVALEQVLDRLEHGEPDAEKQVGGPRQSAFVRIADELIRKGLGPGR